MLDFHKDRFWILDLFGAGKSERIRKSRDDDESTHGNRVNLSEVQFKK